MIAYKYLDARYAQSMLDGFLYMKPASQMRTADGYDDGRSDDQELISRGFIEGGEQVLRAGHAAAAFYHGPGDIVVTGETLEIIDDCVLYCMSTEFNDELAAIFTDKF